MEDKISAEQKGRLEAALGRVNEAIKAEDIGEIKSATEALNQTWQEVSTQIYQQAGGPQGSACGGPEGGNGSAAGHAREEGEEVIDADYEVVDEEKK